VGVVLLPRRSGTLSSNPCSRQPIRNQYSYRPRIPRAQCPWQRSHKLLQFVLLGVNSSCLHLHVSYRPHHQSPPELSTRHHWKWNTIACSSHGSYRCGDRHSRIHATRFCPTVCERHIPAEIKEKDQSSLVHFRLTLGCKRSFFQECEKHFTLWRWKIRASRKSWYQLFLRVIWQCLSSRILTRSSIQISSFKFYNSITELVL